MKLTAIAVILLALALPACQAAPPSYIATRLDFSGSYDYLNDMNNSNVIVGIEDYKGFKVENGVRTYLQIPNGYTQSEAMAISDSGIIVGSVGPKPCYWDPSGEVHLLPDYYGEGGVATDINSQNQIAGLLDFASGYSGGPTVWTDFTQRDMKDHYGYEHALINDQGVLIATDTAHYWGAMYWSEAQGYFLCLGRPSGYNSSASRMNNRGQVLGELSNGTYPNPQVVWTDYQNPRILPAPTDSRGLPVAHRAVDISDSGLVVGTMNSYYGSGSACLWDDSGYYLLDDLVTGVFDGQTELSGIQFIDSLFINDKDQIVVWGSYTPYRDSLFLLTPVPEPSSLVTLLCGVGGVGGLTLRRKRRSR